MFFGIHAPRLQSIQHGLHTVTQQIRLTEAPSASCQSFQPA